METVISWTRETFFKDKIFFKMLIAIALPIVIQNIISSSLGMVDTIMVGSLGEKQIAAVGISNQIYFFYILVSFGIISGGNVFISQFWGAKDTKNVKKVTGILLVSTLIVGIIFAIPWVIFPKELLGIFTKDKEVVELGAKFLRIIAISLVFTSISFTYSMSLRSINKAVVPMVVSVIALIINTILNYALIFGHFGFKAYGVEGTAVATLIARIIEAAMILSYIYYTKSVFAASFKDLTSFSWSFVKRIYSKIIPVVLNESCFGLAILVYTGIYGRMGTTETASIQISNTVSNLFFVISFGLASAAAVMIGNKIGEGDEVESKRIAYKITGIGTFLGVVFGGLLMLFSSIILNYFNVSVEVVNDTTKLLYIIAALMVVRFVNTILIVGVLRGGGDTTFAFLTEAGTMWFVGVPLALIGAFVFKVPVYFVMALTAFEEISKAGISLYRLFSNKWIKNLVHDMK